MFLIMSFLWRGIHAIVVTCVFRQMYGYTYKEVPSKCRPASAPAIPIAENKSGLIPVGSFDKASLQYAEFNFKMAKVTPTGELSVCEDRQVYGYIEDLDYAYIQDLDNNGLTLDLVAIPGGSFMMGNTEQKRDEDDALPLHCVDIKPFFLSRFVVTQAQWRRVVAMPKVNIDLRTVTSVHGGKGDNRPISGVTWVEAVEFCDRLTHYTGREYRLPTEAEWEYACRAGTTTPFHFGETISGEIANYVCSIRWGNGPSRQRRFGTTEVGKFPANEFGLHEMHGNVWEWCQDDYVDNYENASIDGSAYLGEEDNDDTRKVFRGGGYFTPPGGLRSGFRYFFPKTWHNISESGIRIACSAEIVLGCVEISF
jgi:formylglycine-generating enzyme required for sulfatase activity